MLLPESFVKKNLELAKDARFMGIPLEELSRDELIAVAVAGWEAEMRARQDLSKCQKNMFVGR